MEVLALLISDQHPETTHDIFVTEPFNFDNEYKNSDIIQLYQDLNVHIVSIKTLIEMKEHAGRARDKYKITHTYKVCAFIKYKFFSNRDNLLCLLQITIKILMKPNCQKSDLFFIIRISQ